LILFDELVHQIKLDPFGIIILFMILKDHK